MSKLSQSCRWDSVDLLELGFRVGRRYRLLLLSRDSVALVSVETLEIEAAHSSLFIVFTNLW